MDLQNSTKTHQLLSFSISIETTKPEVIIDDIIADDYINALLQFNEKYQIDATQIRCCMISPCSQD